MKYYILRILSISLICLLFQPPHAISLAPKNFFEKDARFEPFDVSLDKALKNRLFHKIFRLKKDLEVLSITEIGDPHHYFQIDKVAITKNLRDYFKNSEIVPYDYRDKKEGPYAIVNLIYLVNDEEGYGIEKKKTFIFNVEFFSSGRLDWDKLYQKIDDTVVCYFYKDEELKKKLFKNSVKKIIFKAKPSNKKYELYYKFGKISNMEVFGSHFFRHFGFKPPKVYSSHNSDHIWLEAIKFDSVFLKKTWKVKRTDLINRIYALGRYTLMSFLLDHNDEHSENILVPSKSINTVIPVDFETIGQGAITKSMSSISSLRIVINYFLPLISSKYFTKEIGLKVFFDGIRSQFLNLKPNFLLKAIKKYEQEVLFSRIVLKATNYYKENGITPYPHYTGLLEKGMLQSLFIEKYNYVLENFSLLVETSI